MTNAKHTSRFPIVGRDARVDLTKYAVKIHGRNVIDYEKLKADNPELYKEILANEFEANRREEAELEEILSAPAMEMTPRLLDSLQSVAEPEKTATSKYFYLPLFLSSPHQAQARGEHEANILIFSDDLGEPMDYASRVLPGQTLAEAVKNDLHTDFAYDGTFQIKNHHFLDATADKTGDRLPRLVVIIKVDRFSTATLRPAGTQVQWSANAATYLKAYGFEL